MMAARESAAEYDVVVYKYGCPHWADFDEAAMQQLRQANGLWNSLVEIQRGYEDDIAAIWAAFPLVAAHQAAVDEFAAVCEQIAADMRATRQKDRTTTPRAEDRRRLADAKKVRKDAKERLKEAKDVAFTSGAKERISEAGKARGEAIKAARRKAAADGLYWGTYNDIVQRRFPAAVKRVKDRRMKGQPAELKFHRFDGTGTLTTQIQKQADDPVPGPATLASDESQWRNVVSLMPAQGLRACDVYEIVAAQPRGKDRHWVLRVRISGDAHLTIPVVLHRSIPAEAEIKEVKVSRRRIAGQHRLSVAVVCRVPRADEKVAGEVVDVDFGWASGGKNVGLRVARVSTASGKLPPPPADVAELVTSGDWTEVWFPAAWRDLLGRDDAIHADRDELLNAVREKVVAALKADPEFAEQIGVTASDVVRWRSPGRFAWLARHVAEHNASAGASYSRHEVGVSTRTDLAAELEGWRQRDRHLWEYECHERDQVIARRRDAYRKIAAWLADAAKLIVIAELDVAAIRRVPSVAAEDPHLQRHSRRQIQAAAPAELKSAIENAARRRGVKVIYRTTEEISDEQP